MNRFLLLFVITIIGLTPIVSSASLNLADQLSGRILLQVQENGEAWYVNPETEHRHFLGRPDDAFNLMRQLGLGISEKDYQSFNNIAPKRLAGKILLRVEANGEAYYVNPVDLKMYYLGRPLDAFNVMRNLGLGITNKDLNKIIVSGKYRNDKYGFELTFLQSWNGYTTKNRVLNFGYSGAVDSVDFGFLIQDSLFNIGIYSRNQWEQIHSLEGGQKPTYLGEKNQYIFGYSIGHDAVNETIMARMNEIKYIVKTFTISN